MRRDYGCVYNYKAAGAVGKYLLLKFGSNDGEVAVATAATDKLIAVSTDIAAADTERADGVRSGLAPVIYGGTVARGDLLTADSTGRAIATTTASNRVIGIAEVSGVVGDIGAVFIAPALI